MLSKVLTVLSLSVLSATTNAALFDRSNGMVYDDVLDITWLQNANYAYTSGHVASNPAGNGLMGISEAIDWAENLSFGGHDYWRLPTISNGPSGELYYMFNNNLAGNCTNAASCDPSFANGGDASDIRSFENIQFINPGFSSFGGAYWYSDLFPTPPGFTLFYVFSAATGENISSTNYPLNFAWAVADGDIAVVPIPAAAWLFGSAILVLAGLRRRNKQ